MTSALSKVMGLLLILSGLWWASMILAFASMIDPSLSDADWWKEYWSKITTADGCGGLMFGPVMAVIGGWLLVVSPGRSSEAGKRVRDEEIG